MRLLGLLFSGALAIAALQAGGAHAENRPSGSVFTRAAAISVCGGPAAQPGQSLHGPILYIAGGDTVCVALAPDPSTWVPVTLARPASDTSVLKAAAFAKNATCVIGADGLGVCDIEGQKLADLLQHPSIVQAALDWR